MSWVDLVQNEFIIVTGDGREYRPLSKNWQKSTEYNISEFNFVNVSGTFVDKKRPKGRRFPLEIYFQGEDHLDDAGRFEESAKDTRPWKVSHPYYGNLTVHASSLTFDNREHNLTKITGVMLETITNEGSTEVEDIPERLQEMKVNTDVQLASIVEVDPLVQNQLTDNATTLYNEGSKSVTGADGNTYFNAFNEANTAILSATSEPLAAMRKVQSLINAPFNFEASVESRFDVFQSQFEQLTSTLTNAFSPKQKKAYEANAGTLIGSMAVTSVNPEGGEYESQMQALFIADELSNTYSTYQATLDNIQSETGGSTESYIPSQEAQTELANLVVEAIAGVLQIALNSQQERILILNYDSDIINLTHQFYGLDEADENMERLINTNSWGLNQMLEVRANTPVIYYVG